MDVDPRDPVETDNSTAYSPNLEGSMQEGTAEGSRDACPRILVVEDEETLRVLLREVLGGAGYLVAEAPSVEEAMRHLQQQRFDLVVSDVGFGGGLTGIDLLRWVNGYFPQLPVILNSGYPLDRGQAGPDVPFLAKPWRTSAMITAVARALQAAAIRGPLRGV